MVRIGLARRSLEEIELDPPAPLILPAESCQPVKRQQTLSADDRHAVRSATKGRCIHCGRKCIGTCKSREAESSKAPSHELPALPSGPAAF